ncbi:putative crossover junction endonuclease mus-81 [Cercophora samala]|uniref:Crossover junction endonuclease MUS81 n=1 Tax=Cercophora samala TaxID=330535 RepID=A0AA39ZA77_9PEZI|nr:putative crossover junction endonuclease mus-81 [Cercophora samala]
MSEPTCANPLWLGWVKEWYDTAKERNSKGVITYKHAYDSLKICPMKLQHPSQCQQLKGFGPKLCERLTQQLQKHCNENGYDMPRVPKRKRVVHLPGEDENDQAAASPAPKRAAIARKPKTYVPQYRSGAFALLLILAGQDRNAAMPGMSKEELIAAAQPHSDASFSIPSDTTKFYTAWGSMKTLEQKELVVKRGRPVVRYALTDEGWEVAARVREVAAARGDVPKIEESTNSVIGSRNDWVGSTSGSVLLGDNFGNNNRGSNSTTGFGGIGTGARSNTSAGNDGEDFLNQLRGANSFLGGVGGPLGGTGSAVASRPAQSATHRTQAATPVILLDDDEEEQNDVATEIQSSVKREMDNEYKDVVAEGEAISEDASLPSFRPIRMAPGTFTIELVLDNREIRAKTDRDYLQEELTKKGIRPITRAMELGDALWVAKCKQPGWLSRMGAEGDEVVLDWIVERKRLDDLIGSIKDGRFHEQKFRLRRSGIKNVIYLVEEISMDQSRLQRSEEMVQSAIASIQVVNGYFLKKTQKIDDTIRYLVSMTQMLQKMYEGKPLHVIPTNVLTANNYLPLMKDLREKKPEIGHHISYPAFSSLCSKSGMMTLRDLFLKMLMVTKGVTGEKAMEIQKVWKTPREFIEAYEQCDSGPEGRRKKIDMVASRLDHLVGRKRFSKQISQKLAEVWGDA